MLIGLAILCTLVEALFTALEVALGAVPRSLLRHIAEERAEYSEKAGDNSQGQVERNALRAERALALSEKPERLALLFITVTSLSLWVAAGSLTWQALASEWPLTQLLAVLAGVLFLAEVLPLLIAARNAEFIVLRSVKLIRFALVLFGPLLFVVGRTAYGLARLMGSGSEVTATLTDGELRSALATAEEEGVIEADERAMLEGAMDFREKVVREVMTPRVDIVAVSQETALPEALELALREGHSRLPVFEGNIDKIVGVVATKDLLPFLRADVPHEACVRDILRPAFVVPETKSIADTLEELRRQRTLLAIAVDAEGGTAGVVTIEDLLEELVGEIQDEYDVEEEPLSLLEEGQAQAVRCEAGSTVREFGRFWERNFHMGATLRDGDGKAVEPSRSLAKLALELFEGLPEPGDKISCGDAQVNTADIRSHFGLQMEIETMDGPRIEKLIIRPVALLEAEA